MEIKAADLRLYAVTDRRWLKEGEKLADPVKELLQAGVTCVQLREKNVDEPLFLQEARELQKLCTSYGVPLIINDRPDIAKKIGASGVHVGLRDMAIKSARELLGQDFIIGASAHNVEEALAAERAGADYIGCGAVFGSSTKENVTALSKEELRKICVAVKIPVVAIGGITLENFRQLNGTGIAGVAVVSGLFAAKDKMTAAKRFLDHRKTALTIAGSDSSGGAGIQADIKTMTAYGVYAMSAIAALTSQNTTGVYGIMEISPEFLGSQLDSIFTDIYPDAVKIGMLPSKEGIRMVGKKLRQYKAKHIVVDPVMVATSGSRLIETSVVGVLEEELFPLAELITPNIPEAETLTGLTIKSRKDMEQAAKKLYDTWKCNVLCKGGHLSETADDLLYENGQAYWICGRKIENSNTHGTGCTLSSAIASGLALGMGLCEAVEQAKAYLTGALAQGMNLGKGNGPLDHMYEITGHIELGISSENK